MPVVRVTLFKGQNHKTKAKIAKEMTAVLERNTGVDPKYVYLVFEDVAAADWAQAGELFEKPQ